MKFTKFQAYYVHDARFKTLACANCVWFQGPDQCQLVSGTDEPDAGRILPSATCNLWNAGPLRVVANRVLRGRGVTKGVGPGVLRVLAERKFVPPPHTVPPPEVMKRLRSD